MKRILIIGSGGREHALGWKLSLGGQVEEVYYTPGNGGTSPNLPFKASDLKGLLEFAEEKKCFTIVGPEDPLEKGIVDLFEEKGLPIFGPRREAARLETSKAFAKTFMKNHEIPTADFQIFTDLYEAVDCIESKGLPKVVKADGLASGKGALICHTLEEAKIALYRIMVKREFGASGDRIVVEDFLEGYEVSFIGLSDGSTFTPLATSQDHKRVFDGDRGANTGGMGAYSPVPMVSDELYEKIMDRMMKRVVEGMKAEGIPFRGVLYAGLMIVDEEPYVLEFNCRFGDPETQPTLMRMKSDLLPYLEASAEGTLNSLEPIKWEEGSSVCVVMASKGYPQPYETGKKIHGLEEAYRLKGVKVFHAGTARRDRDVVTSGGRVLGVTALGRDLNEAVKKAYEAVSLIRFEGAHYRKDIGYRALNYTRKT